VNGARPPIVIIGMHRSGTSLLTRVLQRSGLFMGRGASRNEEAAFTNAVNAWLFREASATWDRPESLDWLLADGELRPWLVDYMEGICAGPAAARFLGVRRWLRHGGLQRVTEPWGFKDPRTTYTLPLWLQLFPEARVLHIVRHGVDVAASLRARRRDVFERSTARYDRRRALYRNAPLAPKRRGFGPQVRCGTLTGAFDLWELYVDRAREHVAALGERALELRYERLLVEPAAELERALAFCGLEAPAGVVEAAARDVDPGRAFAYRGDTALATFAEEVAPRLARHGYGGPGECEA
jgi:hypothetical protein